MTASDSGSSGAVPGLLDQLRGYAGLLTVSGITAVIYAVGYAALNQRAVTLGVPDTSAGTGAHFKAGYFFFIESGAALWRSMGEHWVVTATIAVLSLALVISRHVPLQWPTRSDHPVGIVGWLAVTGVFLVALSLMVDNARLITAALAADNLLLRDVKSLAGISPQAQLVVDAIADVSEAGRPATDGVQRQYRGTVGATALAAAALTLAAVFARRLPTGAPASIVGYLKWVSLGGLACQCSLLPFLYGTSYLTKAPSCVDLRLADQYMDERGILAGHVKGFLVSGLESATTTIQVLKVQDAAFAELHLVDPAHVDAVRFRDDCGSAMPNYRKKRLEALGQEPGSVNPRATP
jgi:hypothetical protein